MEVITCTHDLSRKAGAYLNTALHEHEGTPILLLLSGGSALSMLEYIDLSTLAGHITVSVLDERYTTDSAGSNFAKVTELLADSGVQFLPPFPLRAENPVEAARFFEASLRNWCDIYPDGVVIATMGMGADGHTAGIFPFVSDEGVFNKQFVATEDWVRGYTAPNAQERYQERVTVTVPFLQSHVDHTLVFISGKDDKVKELLAEAPLHQMPSQVFKQMKRVTVMTDNETEKPD